MSFEQKLLLLLLAAFVLGLTIFLIKRPKWREELGDTADLDPKYRDGPTLRYGRDTPRIEELRSDLGLTKVNKRHITLTPRQLEHINILRRRDGRLPLSAVGFRAAIARQATAAEPRAVCSANDWTLYLIAYAALSSDHQQGRVACEHTIVISPDMPYNGQGGTYAGAGATSSFEPLADADLNKAATQGLAYGSAGGLVAALAAGSAFAGADPGPPEPQSAPEPAPAPQPAPQPDPPTYQAPDPPAYQAPDPPASGGFGGTD